MKEDEQEGMSATIMVSFVDVLTCTLGAMVLLFMIFIILEQGTEKTQHETSKSSKLVNSKLSQKHSSISSSETIGYGFLLLKIMKSSAFTIKLQGIKDKASFTTTTDRKEELILIRPMIKNKQDLKITAENSRIGDKVTLIAVTDSGSQECKIQLGAIPNETKEHILTLNFDRKKSWFRMRPKYSCL